MKENIKSILRFIIFFTCNWRGKQRLSIIKTVYYNFYLFPFNTARKFPLFIHAGVRTYKMGKIIIEGEIKKGMISIGYLNFKSQEIAKIFNVGTIIFKGPVILDGATVIENSGTIIFEGETQVGEGTSFLIRKQLTIGKFTRMGFNCFVMDSDEHYMVNIQTGEIKTNKKEIIIGRCNWLANRTIVKKGTCTPDYTIVASANALLSKDYTDIIPPYSIIGGAPAKLIASGYRRIYNRNEEKNLYDYFQNNDVSSLYINLENTDIEEYCTSNPLKC